MRKVKTSSLSATVALCMALFGAPQPLLAQEADEPVLDDKIGINPEAMALATQIIDEGFPEEDREKLFFETMDQVIVQMRVALEPTLPEGDEGAIAILDEWLLENIAESKEVLRKHIPSLMDGMAQSFANLFTVQELTDILAFVQTPSGKRYFELYPKALSDEAFASANQAYIEEYMSRMPDARADLVERLQQYFLEKLESEETPET